MWIFKWFFKEKGVVEILKEDHKKIVDLYLKISKFIERGQTDKLPKLLKEFYYLYSKHILYEDNYFFSRLNTIYKDDKDKKTFINSKREEMDEITKFIEKFMSRFKTVEEISSNFDSFKKEFQIIGEVLSSRVAFEESDLYPLYK